MLLAIDCGNTRTKWAVFNAAGDIFNQGACLNAALTTIDFSPRTLAYDHVVISNVAGEQHATALSNMLTPYNFPIHWLKSTAQICGVLNQYSTPDTLGADRWAALIASWHINQAPCIVVNAGTAVTIDALSLNNKQAIFMGGLILPGFSLMQQSLSAATAQLPIPTLSEHFQHDDIFAKNTGDAIRLGALQAISGAIILMANTLETQCKQAPAIVISGGNAKIIKDNLVGHVTNLALIVDNLVLQGLYLIDNFMQSEQQ